MKVFALCLSLLIGAKSHGAVADDIARAFLINTVANGAQSVLTNSTVAPLTNGANFVATNIQGQAGASSSNFTATGLIFFGTGSFTNLNGSGTLTNLASITIPANTLTNTGDSIRADWGGRMANALANTNQFQLVYGSQVVLDTGLQRASNTVFKASAILTRTGPASQHVEATFVWGPGGGVPFAETNVNLEISQTNGINNLFVLKGGALRPGAHTNNSLRVIWSAIR